MRKRAYLVYFDIGDPTMLTADKACEVLTRVLRDNIPMRRPTAYIATSHWQPEQSNRKAFEVHIELTDEPGPYHTQESAHNSLRNLLAKYMPGLNGGISLAPDSLQTNES